MSGIEAKSIRSIISWTITTIDKAVEIYDDAGDLRELPPEFESVYRGLLPLRAALEKIKPRVELEREDGPGFPQDALNHAKRCQEGSLRLEAMFRRVLPKAGVPSLKHPSISRMDQYRIALSTSGNHYEVASLLTGMIGNAQELARNFLKEEDKDFQDLIGIQEALQATKLSVPISRRNSQVVLTHWGSGISNSNLGNGPQYNNDGGKQFNATTQIFGAVGPRSQDPLEILQQEKQACFASLRYATFSNRRNRLDEERAHEGTCNWLFETDEFQKWQNRRNLERHNGVLWIKGHPGTGKSTLMMHNLTHCEKEFKHHVICAHFFSARGDSDEKSPLGLWRSLVYQMVDKEPLLYDRLVPIFRKKQSMIWTENELRNFLRSEMESPQPRPFLFLIDALDECDNSSARRVVEFLEKLSGLAVKSNIALNICLSSRYYPNISVGKCIDLFVDEREEHKEDIKQYVCDKVPSDLSSVRDEIIEKAGNVFLWVVLVIAMLKKKIDAGRPEEIKDEVRRAPKGLNKLFKDILTNDKSNRAETILMFQLVLFAKRLLKPEELYFATIAGTQPERLGPWDQSAITEQTIWLRIRDSSKGLIEVLKGSNTVQFIHLSVNDFLTRNNRLHTFAMALHEETGSRGGELSKKDVAPASFGWWPILTSFSNSTISTEDNVSTQQPGVVESSNNSIAECCKTYLTKIARSPPLSSEELMELEEKHPFLNYSSSYILHHAEDAQPEGPAQEAVIKWLLDDPAAFETFRSIHNGFEEEQGLHCYTGAKLIHMVAFHGHRNILSMLLKRRVDVNAQFGPMNSAIQIVSERGDTAMVSILLEHGANPNLCGGIYGSALQVACKKGHREVVALLLNKGARINAQGGIYGTALQAAATEERAETVRFLLENGADVNIRAGYMGTALQAACEKSEIAAILLLKAGADPHARCGYFGTALQAAAVNGKSNLVEALLEQGVDVNAQNGLFGSALQAAVYSSDEATIKLLLQSGADVGIQGGVQGSILEVAIKEGTIIANLVLDGSYLPDIQAENRLEKIKFLDAARNGEIETVEKLIENGYDVNLRGGLLGSALQAASWSGNDVMVEKLLGLGADVNLQSGTYGTALQAASARKYFKIVRILIMAGADVNAQGGLFGNALQAAARSGSMSNVKLLLENGANINAEGGHYGTAFQAAMIESNRNLVNLLLENGADIGKQGGKYGTALIAASRQGIRALVKELLEKGADVNAQGGLWNTALQAASRDDEDIVKILLKHGADVNLRGGNYGTALNAAATAKERSIMDLLIRHGADPNAYIWDWSEPYRWNMGVWFSQSTVWIPASGIITLVFLLLFAVWKL